VPLSSIADPIALVSKFFWLSARREAKEASNNFVQRSALLRATQRSMFAE
jgi:hypothetical protein